MKRVSLDLLLTKAFSRTLQFTAKNAKSTKRCLHFPNPFSALRSLCSLRFNLIALLLFSVPALVSASNVLLNDSAPLYLPQVGDHQLRLLSPTLLELMLVTTKAPDPAPVTQWNFVDTNGNLALPDPSQFAITANGQQLLAQILGFKRRVLYAALNTYDLRIANYLYLELASPIANGSFVQVRNPSGSLWAANVLFTLTVDPLRYSPAIHVNQVGYVPALPKKAIVGYYLGGFGELPIPTAQGFQLISTATGSTVFSGPLTHRSEVGWLYLPSPYQQVYEADFSAFQTPGQYKLVVPGLGASLPFYLTDGVAAAWTRAYELGIYGQRCGTNNVLPYTRFIHGPCHTNVVQVPTLASPEFDFANYIAGQLGSYVGDHPAQTAPFITNAVSSRYPFVRQGTVDLRGGHHDAGDYSKYTINVAQLIHYLVFAVDAFPGVASLDNLGIPESGDGISDFLQEAKWEADFLVKMQDTDGAFYFNIYPKDRQYETDVLPDHGDPQIVMPKTTSATAAAVGALAEIASSPAFKAAYPNSATNYLSKALSGWSFLTNAFKRYTRAGAFQAFSSLGDSFTHDDELAWAAAALYGATGNTNFDNDLRTNTPKPNDPSVRLYGWLGLFEGYGCAFRDYAFAARTGRLQASQLNSNYLFQCQMEILYAATNALQWCADNAYGSSFFDVNKPLLTAGWYFSSERAFDLTVEYQLNPLPAYLDAILRNFNYELGCNPVNICYVTGLGSKRQRQIVDQYSENDYLVMPRSGIPLGNIQQGFDYLYLYGSELAHLSYPSDGTTYAPYPMYDRWGDSWNGPTEFVVSEQSSRAMATTAWLMAQTPLKTQVWNSAPAQISGVPPLVPLSQTITSTIVCPTLDLSQASVVWDVAGLQPALTPSFVFSPAALSTNRMEVEAQLPDGRRVFAITNFFGIPANNPSPLLTNADMVALYRLDTNYSDAMHRQLNLAPSGATVLDPIGAHFNGFGDHVFVSLTNADVYDPKTTQAISVEGRFYINSYSPEGLGQSILMELMRTSGTQLQLEQAPSAPVPDVYGGSVLLLPGTILTNTFSLGQWHVLNLSLAKTNYSITVDGVQIFSTNSFGVLSNWAGSIPIQLQAGDFNGWLQNLVVRNVRAPQLNVPTKLTGDGVQLTFPGSAGTSYSVRASTNLVNWVTLGAATQTQVIGVFQFIDTQATNYSKRFYRVSIP
jgi:hypothetical protein